MLSGAAGRTPILRKNQPIPGAAISASCAVPCSGAPEWMPIRSAARGTGHLPTALVDLLAGALLPDAVVA